MNLTWPDDYELQDPATIPRMDEEAREQCRLVAALRRHWHVLDEERRPIVFAAANGGKRNPAEAANLKAQGVLAGVPDLIILLPGNRTILIEMKARDGRLSTAQKGLHAHIALLNHLVITAYSAEDALNLLRNIR